MRALLAQLFQTPSESSGSCFHLIESRSSSESKVKCFIILQTFFIATEADCGNILKTFCNGGKQKTCNKLYAN